MTWKPETPGQRRFALVGVTVLFVLTWTSLLFWTIGSFRSIQPTVRFYAVCFLILYPVPWIQTVVEKPRSMSMVVVTYIALMAAVQTLRHM